MSVYFTSDLHFGHELMLKKYPNFRKGANAAEMDENLIAVWNALITSEDVVYDLGDVSFHKDFVRTYEILRRLNGRHFLVLGNHDEQIVARKNELLRRRKADGNFVFEQIADYAFIRLGRGVVALPDERVGRLSQGRADALRTPARKHRADRGQSVKCRL